MQFLHLLQLSREVRWPSQRVRLMDATDTKEVANCTAALTLHQPWASHLVYGVKQTEGCAVGQCHGCSSSSLLSSSPTSLIVANSNICCWCSLRRGCLPVVAHACTAADAPKTLVAIVPQRLAVDSRRREKTRRRRHRGAGAALRDYLRNQRPAAVVPPKLPDFGAFAMRWCWSIALGARAVRCVAMRNFLTYFIRPCVCWVAQALIGCVYVTEVLPQEEFRKRNVLPHQDSESDFVFMWCVLWQVFAAETCALRLRRLFARVLGSWSLVLLFVVGDDVLPRRARSWSDGEWPRASASAVRGRTRARVRAHVCGFLRGACAWVVRGACAFACVYARVNSISSKFFVLRSPYQMSGQHKLWRLDRKLVAGD